MAQGFPTGGRQVGTPNNNRTAVRERLAFIYPCLTLFNLEHQLSRYALPLCALLNRPTELLAAELLPKPLGH